MSNASNMSFNATMPSEPGPFINFLGHVAYQAHIMKPLLPTYLLLLVSACLPIYIASYASLVRPSSAAPPRKRVKSTSEDEESEEVSQKIENLSTSDAVMFPVLAGITLTTLYLVLKYLNDPSWLNWGLNLYFSQMCLFFSYGFLSDSFTTIRSLIFPTTYSSNNQLYKADLTNQQYISTTTDKTHTSPFPGILHHLPVPGLLSRLIWRFRTAITTKANLTLHIRHILTLTTHPTLLSLLAIILSAILTYTHTFITKPWPLTNFFGLSFCYGSLQLTSPNTAATATLLLSALFFYDIYFVFYTPMMVHVATNLDVPIKLLFPRPDGCIFPKGAPEGSELMEEYLRCIAKKRTMAMLGLGDIVVPGLVIAFALRFDLWRHYLYLQQQANKSGSAKKKKAYSPVTGLWGERFWTSSTLKPESLKAKRFSTPYFTATMVGYVLGLVVTLVVMQVWQHAQPALLYLVPGVLGSLWGMALLRGEVGLLWGYTEGEEEDEKQKKKSEENKQGKDGEMGAADGGATTESKALVKSDTTESATSTNKKNNDTPKIVSAKDKLIQEHVFYLAIKLPSARASTTGTSKTRTSKDITITTSKDTTTKAITSADERDDDDSEEVDGAAIATAVVPKSQHVVSRRTTRSRGGKANGKLAVDGEAVGVNVGVDVDEEGVRMAKRRRKV